MEELLRFVGISVIGAVLAVLLRKNIPEISILLTIAFAVAAVLYLLQDVKTLWDELQALLLRSEIDGDIFVPLIKVLGISLVTRCGGAICKDAGENAMAVLLQLAGMICAVLTTIPLMEEVVEMLLMYL